MFKRADLKSLLIPEFPTTDMEFVPSNPDSFATRVIAYVGPEDSKECDAFEFVWCTWPGVAPTQDSPVALRSHIMVSRWTRDGFDRLTEYVSELCSGIEGPDWDSIGRQLSRWLDWEMDERRA